MTLGSINIENKKTTIVELCQSPVLNSILKNNNGAVAYIAKEKRKIKYLIKKDIYHKKMEQSVCVNPSTPSAKTFENKIQYGSP